MAVVIEEPSVMDRFLECGLFVGAIFQLICIFAVIVLPTSNNNNDQQQQNSDNKVSVFADVNSCKPVPHDHSTKAVRKRNKKNR